MARYANLKDYFQHEHIQLIQDAISDYLRHDVQISETVIHSLVCTNDDDEYNAEFEIGVSVNAVDVEETDALKFIITVRGNLEKRFKDIHVMSVRNINDDSFPKDNILSQFILPDIPKGKIEDIGNDLYGSCVVKGLFEDYKLCIEKYASNGMIHFAPLPDNCLGRVILSESDVDIIQNAQTEYGLKPQKCTIRAAHGTILLNYRKYSEEMDGGLRITVAHELVHTLFHGRFLKLLQMLGEERIDMHSSTEPVAFDENMTDIQKALCIAEWQADVLAMRLAIPSATADPVMREIDANPHTRCENIGDKLQACVIIFANIYGVSCYVAKERLRQLGYDDVDGTFIIIDGCMYQPFLFPRGTLKENESFVINRDSYERLLRENKEFAELINSGRYVYLGYVVCQLDAEYIDVVPDEDDIRLVLSEYARENAHKCLLKFQFRNENTSDTLYYYKGASYLNKIPEFNKIVPESFDLCEEDAGLGPNTVAEIKEYNDTLDMLNSPECKKSFANTVVYYMQKKEIEDTELSERIKLTVPAIKKIYTGETEKVNVRNVMALCIGLELDSGECYDMFEKAGYDVREDTMQNRAYRFLFNCTRSDLQECNKILRVFNQEELPYHQGQQCKKER